MAQPTLANKLRPAGAHRRPAAALPEGNLTERHARAVLALEDAESAPRCWNRRLRRQLTVQQTEQLVQKLLLPPPKPGAALWCGMCGYSSIPSTTPSR
ncbi:MAG: hypothetical protein ACLU9S_04125 [Oscillospiraceae bacterium]